MAVCFKSCEPLGIAVFSNPGLLKTQSALGEPSGLQRMLKKTPRASPDLSMPRRNCLGMIWSVSQLSIGSGAATAVSEVSFSMLMLLLKDGANR